LPSWSDLKKPATHGCPNSLSLSLSLSSAFAFACLTFSEYARPLELLSDPSQLHTNALELRIYCYWSCWVVAEIAVHWQQTFDTCVTKNAGHVHPSTKMNCTLRLSSKAWLASGISASARHRYLLMSEMQWTVTRLFPAALAFPCCIWSSVQRSWAKLCGLWPSCGEKLKLDIQIVHIYTMHIYIYIICRNKLKTTTNHKTQVPATRYFLSHTQRSIRGETTIHRLLVCNNTPRAV